MDKRIYIVRHGQTELNKAGIVQGSGVDAPLNTTGWQQADAFFEFYKDIDFEVIITSALQRTHQTMEPFIRHGLPWEQFPEINEMGWGIHEGKPSTPSMRKEYQEVVNAWNSGQFDARLGGGESAAEMEARIQTFVNHLKSRPEKTLLVCSHGRAMRCLMCILKGVSITNMDQYQHSNTGLWIAKLSNGKFHIELENDTRHLQVENRVIL